jgi:hypothetical protein
VTITRLNTNVLIKSSRRQVLVSLLGMPERFDWKECEQSEEDDKRDVQQFKDAFSVFDPSL